MLHYNIGNIGHLLVIISLVTSLLAAFAYFKATVSKELGNNSWLKFARYVFYLHGVAVFGVVISLFFIIYNHYFEYHYAWSHSSIDLPIHYMISCFWEGQEGSFLIWIFWQVILGFILIRTNKKWEAPVMTVFAAVQAFLASMILGVVFGDVKIGSSPFVLLRDVINDPVFLINPDFVPENGTGLNPLLQNYWMVIHPPTLFLGFATTLIPFSFCIAGLWTGKFREWVRPALPWAIFSAMILGIGILMGAYWAYETLNFGGYWNWDPVENAVYVPWLVLVASLHTMIAFKKSANALKTSIILVIATFILVLYSTFLVRSGILGDTSVHSFTDLGLSGQLLVYLLFFLAVSIFFSIRAWKQIPSSTKEASAYSREFWIFIGALTLCLMGFQVLVPTSFPVFNKIIEWFGGISNLAPPADQIAFYSQWQLWFAIAIAILSGTGQFFYWNKMDREKLKTALTIPVILTLLISAIIFVYGKIFNPVYIIILTASTYSIIANSKILFNLLKSKSYKLTGGSVAHIGIAMMLLGIMFSEGYSKVVSLNTTMISREFTEEQNSSMVVLFLNDPKNMGDYELTYKREGVKVKGIPGYVTKSFLTPTENVHFQVAKREIITHEKTYAVKGDTLYLQNPENSYFEIDYKPVNNAKSFTLYPRSQVNENMGLLSSPDVKKYWNRDLYTYVASIPTFDEETKWSETDTIEVRLGERFFVNDYVAELTNLERVKQVNFVDLGPNDVAVKASIKIYGDDNVIHTAEPLFIIKDNVVGKQPEVIKEVASKISLDFINPEKGTVSLGVNTTQKDYVILKALEKPHINVLWIGTLIMVVGFIIAIRRRYIEFMKMRDKEG